MAVPMPCPPPPSLPDSASDTGDVQHWDDGNDNVNPAAEFPEEAAMHVADGDIVDAEDEAGGNFSDESDADEPPAIVPGGAPDEEAAPPAKKHAPRGTGQWYFDNRDLLVWPGTTATVLDVCLWLAGIKSDFRLPDAAVDAICLMIHWLLLPKDNNFPPSYHLIRAALGVPATVTCVRHVCDSCWKLFPAIQPDQHGAHKDEKCNTQGCDRPRFMLETSGKPVPRRSAYFFGEEETFLDLVSKPGMLDAVLEHRKESLNQPESFWGSEAGASLNRACGYKFTHPADDEVAVVVSLGVPQLHLSTSMLNGSCLNIHPYCGMAIREMLPLVYTIPSFAVFVMLCDD